MSAGGELDRRGFLHRMGAGAALVLTACGDDGSGGGDPDATGGDASSTPDGTGGGAPVETIAWEPASVALAPEVFPMGVSVGAVRDTSALVWGFTEDGEDKRLRIWDDLPGGSGEVALVVDALATPMDGYFKVEIVDLAPGTRYHYGWFDDDVTLRSVIGTFVTGAGVDDLRPIVVAATSCTKWTKAPYESLVVAGAHDFDVFCHLGDMSYNDEAETLEAYRAKWRQTLQDPGYVAVMPKAAFYGTLDDHEIANNFDEIPPEPERLEAALDAFFEALPIPRHEGDRIWDSYRLGGTMEIFVLDCRTEKQIETRQSDDPIYISKAQMAWLKQGLSDSPCHFKVVLNSVPITDLPEGWPNPQERWQGYGKQRDELLDHIVDGDIANVWFLAGDIHVGLVTRVEREGPRSHLWEILPGPGAPALLNPVPGIVDLDPSLGEQLMPPDMILYGSSEYAATLLTFDPAADTVHVKFVHTDGETVLYEGTLSQA